MDIEHLSKSQIILLTLLVSFVTSIATGIVTVSLMDQAPPVIAQTVNRVIEHTIQTVASSTPAKAQTAATVVTRETVVVSESDLISGAVSKIEPSIVHLYTSSEDNPIFLGLGIVLDGSGMLITDAEPLADRSEIVIALRDGVRVRGFVIKRDDDNGLAFIQGATSTPTRIVAWAPARIAANQAILGQSVVAISGKTSTRIAPGVITALVAVGGGRIIDTNISAEALVPGSPIVTTEGTVVGVSTSASRASSLQGFVPASVLLPPAPTKK
jgi:hypothetical protein